MKKTLPTEARLKEVLKYSAETGLFTWVRPTSFRVIKGATAGTIAAIGYRYIGVDGVICLAHRMAFVFMTGEWPVNYVDHINGDRLDNRWANLRDVSQAVNCQNRRNPTKSSLTKIIGVHGKSVNSTKPFTSAIHINRKKIHLGCFDTQQEASAAYVAAKRQLHPGGML